jgi:hypothetical protein
MEITPNTQQTPYVAAQSEQQDDKTQLVIRAGENNPLMNMPQMSGGQKVCVSLCSMCCTVGISAASGAMYVGMRNAMYPDDDAWSVEQGAVTGTVLGFITVGCCAVSMCCLSLLQRSAIQ